MSIGGIKDTEALPDDWMSNLSSLKELHIQESPLKSLSLAVPHLTSLESLEIRKCELFDSISDMGDDGTEWQHLRCLSSLCYRSVPNLKSIPSGLQHVTALRRLEISDCPNLTIFPELTSVVYLEISKSPNLTSIPDGISNLTSLEELRIYDCPNLISLPDEMVSLKSLQKLTILRSPGLARRCKRGIGEDCQILLGYLKNTSPLSLNHATRNITSEYRQAWNITEKICCLFTASCYSNYLATTEKLRVIGVCLPEL
nr:putative disease resistance protein rga4 [Quercus suber]